MVRRATFCTFSVTLHVLTYAYEYPCVSVPRVQYSCTKSRHPRTTVQRLAFCVFRRWPAHLRPFAARGRSVVPFVMALWHGSQLLFTARSVINTTTHDTGPLLSVDSSLWETACSQALISPNPPGEEDGAKRSILCPRRRLLRASSRTKTACASMERRSCTSSLDAASHSLRAPRCHGYRASQF